MCDESASLTEKFLLGVYENILEFVEDELKILKKNEKDHMKKKVISKYICDLQDIAGYCYYKLERM